MNLDYESAAKYFFICMAIWAPVLAPVVQKRWIITMITLSTVSSAEHFPITYTLDKGIFRLLALYKVTATGAW